MVEVHLWSGLRSLAGGCEVVSVEARDTGEMLRALVRAHPELQAPSTRVSRLPSTGG